MTHPADGHLVHGLTGDQTAPVWSPMTEADLATVLQHFVDGAAPKVLWQSPRPFSDAARVQCGSHQWFIKRHPALLRSAASLTEEHRFMVHLRTAGIPVPDVLTGKTGTTAITLGHWTYEVLHPLKGDDTYADTPSWVPPDNPQHAQAAGKMLAKLHQAAASFRQPDRHTHLLIARDDILRATNPLAAIEQQLSERPALAQYLHQRPHWRAELQPLADHQAALQSALISQPRLWTHNDWHVSNLGWQGDHVSDVFDFGLSANTFALYDLATAIERNCVSWLTLENNRTQGFAHIAQAILQGYHASRPLSAEDRQLLPRLLPLVHWDFALSEVEYFFGIEQSAAKADVAWTVFLLGHFNWFCSKQGANFLDVICNFDAT